MSDPSYAASMEPTSRTEPGTRAWSHAVEFARATLAELERPPFEMFHALAVSEVLPKHGPFVELYVEDRTRVVDLAVDEVAAWLERRFCERHPDLAAEILFWNFRTESSPPAEPLARVEALWGDWQRTAGRTDGSAIVRARGGPDARFLEISIAGDRDRTSAFDAFFHWLQSHDHDLISGHDLRLAPPRAAAIDDDDAPALEHAIAFAQAWLDRLEAALDLRHVIYVRTDPPWPCDRPTVFVMRDDATAEVHLFEEEVCNRIAHAYRSQHPRLAAQVAWYADYCK
ncbi:MAG: hypothetical protein H6730_34155 [Deltaproteobacteria bacterium]|nr:hypothetical protein [Deltaproteobacteria bacterium]